MRRHFEPCLLATALLVMSGCAGSAGPHGAAIVVGPNGDDSSIGTAAAPLRSLGRALQVVRPGESIELLAGTFSEQSGETWSYRVPDGVTIRGAGSGQSILQTPAPESNTFV